jgi:hypothetical protein
MMRGTECGLSPAPHFAGHSHKVEVPRYAWFPRVGEQKKGQEPFPVPTLFVPQNSSSIAP